ncbi:MAG: hypothetical protein ACOYT9_02485 [Patescibacteria group bacterium]
MTNTATTKLTKEFFEIVSTQETFIYLDEPLVFWGYNQFGIPVVISKVDEDAQTNSYIHTLVSENDISNYVTGNKSLLSVIKEREYSFITKYATDGNLIEFSYLPTEEIPDDYLPGPKSFYVSSLTGSTKYKIHISGGMAHRHIVKISEATTIQKFFSKIFTTISSAFDSLNFQAYALPSQEGSFELGFSLEQSAKDQQMDMLTTEKQLIIQELLRYSYIGLHKDINSMMTESTSQLPDFHKLMNKIQSIQQNSGNTKSLISEKDMMYLFYTVNNYNCKIAKVLESDFQYTEISLLQGDDDQDVLLATIDPNQANRMTTTKGLFEKNLISKDPSTSKFEINIYVLNRNSGKGWATVRKKDDPLQTVYHSRISISRSIPLENSKYTESMSQNKNIEVDGRATSIKGRIVLLSIEEK